MRPTGKSIPNPLMADVNEFYWEKFVNDVKLANDGISKFPFMSELEEIQRLMDEKNKKNLFLTLAHKSSKSLHNLTDAFSEFQVLASQKKERKWNLFSRKPFTHYTACQNMKSELGKIKKELEDTDAQAHEKSKPIYRLTYGDPGNTSQIIGLDKHVENIKKRLKVHDSTVAPFKVIGIYGMCGTGKTTLAQKVFNDPKVCETFDPRIWLCCSHTMLGQVDRMKILKMVFEELGYDFYELNDLGITELLAAMKHLLNGKKYLFVVDDVWGTYEWFEGLDDNPKEDMDMKRFSDGLPRSSGGAVLLTCRNPYAAMKMVGRKNSYSLEPLEEESCDKIFHQYMEVNLDGKSVPEVIHHCHGLPLAAKELGCVGKDTTHF